MKISEGWVNVIVVIEENDFYMCGIVVLGFDVLEVEFVVSFEVVVLYELVKGFVVGCIIFGDVVCVWMKGDMMDEEVVM